MINPSPPYSDTQITKFIFVFLLFFIPLNVNSEVNLTEILDGKSKDITREIRKLGNELNSLTKDKNFNLTHENEKLRVTLLGIGQKLKSLKQDSNMLVDKNSQTSEIYDFAIDILNTLVCEKYQLGEFSKPLVKEFNVKC